MASSPDKPKRRGPRPLAPIPAGRDPLDGVLKVPEAGAYMRKAPGTVRKLLEKGELKRVGPDVWGPSIKDYWERNLTTGPRAPEPDKPKRGRPKKMVASIDKDEAA
jgi:hypothetical protein